MPPNAYQVSNMLYLQSIMKNLKAMKDEHTCSLTMRKIFVFMMENGYEPRYEDGYILFEIEDNTAVLEYEDGILYVRTFFSIDEDSYDMFLEASNLTMTKTVMIRPVVMEDMKSIMFSCETICDNMNDFKRYLPRLIENSKIGLDTHKNEMREIIRANEALSAKMPISDDFVETGKARNKILS